MANALYGRCEANKPITISLGNKTMVFAPAQFWPTYWLAKNRADYNYHLIYELNQNLNRNEAGKILKQFSLVTQYQTSFFTDNDYKKVLLLRIRLEKVKVYIIKNSRLVTRGDSYLSVNRRSALSVVQYDKPGAKARRDKLAIELSNILVQRRGSKLRADDTYWSANWLSRQFIVAGSVIMVFVDSVVALVKLGVAIVAGLYTVVTAYVRTLATGDFKAVQNDLKRLFNNIVVGIEKLEDNIKKGYDIVSTIWNDESSKKLLLAFMSEYVDGTSVVDSATFKIALTIDVILIIGTLGAGAVVVGARLAHRVGQFTVRALNFMVDLWKALKLLKNRRVIESRSPAKNLPAPKARSSGGVDKSKSPKNTNQDEINVRQPGLNRIALERTKGLGSNSTTKELLSSGAIPGKQGVILDQKTVVFNDIWKMSEKSGVEFILTKENGIFILRSGSPTSAPIKSGVRPIIHTHPKDTNGVNSLLPSNADINILNAQWARNPNGPRPVSQILTGEKIPTRFYATGIDQLPNPKVNKK